jgi:macrolide-specific efflux system membrane fusion protein
VKLRLIAAVALIALGAGAIGLVIVRPGSGANAPQYLTAAAAVTDVVAQASATGSLQAVTTYGLRFGEAPRPASSSTSSSASSSSASSGSGSSTAVWPVSTVTVAVGDVVTRGQVLATADTSDANTQLLLAKANLAAAQARLASDKAGADPVTRAQAADSIKQAQQQLSSARSALSTTQQKNALAVSQAQTAVTAAENQLSTDESASAPQTVIDQDIKAIQQAKDNLASAKVNATASNSSASQQVAAASLSVTIARDGYNAKVAPASAAQIASDNAAVLTAQSTVADAEAALNYSKLTSPEDGVVTAISITPGLSAPATDAIDIQSTALQVVAQISESDVVSLKVGQPTTVTIGATKAGVDGTVASVSPIASSSGSSSVVTYQIVVSLPTPPAGALAGMSASVAVTTAQASNVLAVPAAALVGSAGSYSVRVLSGGQAVVVPVGVGLITSAMAEITSGLTAGQTVITGVATQRTGTTGTGTGGAGLGIPVGGGFGGGGGGNFRGANP